MKVRAQPETKLDEARAVAEGQLFSETGLLEAKRRLVAPGIFERVDVSTKAGSGPAQITVTVEVE